MSNERMPRLSAVALAQLDLLIRTKYMIAIVVLPFFCLGIMHRVAPDPGTLPPWMMPPIFGSMYLQFIFIGGIAAALVWVYDSPRNRRYHWAMPVRREVHDVMRVVAGAVWLMMAIGIVCVFGWFAEDSVLREQWLSEMPVLYWLGLFLVSLLTYLLITIPSLLAGRPIFWVVGGILLIVILRSNPVANAVPAVARTMAAVFWDEDQPSLGSALSGGYRIAPWNDEAQRQRVFNATSAEFFERNRILPRVWQSAPIAGMIGSPVVPLQPRSWLLALLLWFTVAVCGITLAVRRRPDV